MELIIVAACLLVAAFAYSLRAAGTKPVVGSDYYAVSRDGRVLLTRGARVQCLRALAMEEGLRVTLRSGTRTGNFFVHDLVAEAHLPNPAGRQRVRHKDGNKRNNAVDNLEWY
ncbi:HNH endonuclease [Pseudoduganella sp. LjRoot289]|uniref:HNH endonuclease n=1 Tax=Pseudoduganella sp. LjRoot289 TaxID=3342314 RepID=UPI003ECD08EE